MNQYKICEVCGIKYFDDPRKKRGRKKKYPVCGRDTCTKTYYARMKRNSSKSDDETESIMKRKEEQRKRIQRCADAIFRDKDDQESWTLDNETDPELDPDMDYPLLTNDDYKCKRMDCKYRSSDRTNGTCDYCLIEHRARHLICSIKDCTEYTPGKRPRTQPM